MTTQPADVDNTNLVESAPPIGPANRFAAQPLAWIAACTLALAVGLRLWIISGPLGTLNADETLSGIMARELLDGHVSTFYWGQNYGGTIELVPFAALVAMLGDGIAIIVLPLSESIVIGVLLFVIARRRVGSTYAMCTVALAAVLPASSVWFSTRAMLFYQPVVIAGLGTILMAEQLAEDRLDSRQQRWRWAILGVLIGAGWWTSTQIVFFAVPAIVWLVLRRAIPSWRGPAIASCAAFVGAAPWLIANVRTGGRSLTELPGGSGGYVDHLRAQAERGWPMTLGLRRPFDERWIVAGTGWILAIVAVCALTAVTWAFVRTPHIRTPLVGVVLVFPLVHALAPSGDYVGTGRYYVFVVPVVAYLVIATLSTMRSPRRWVGGALVVAAAMTTWTLYGLRNVQPGVDSTDALSDELLERDVEHVYSNYWTGYMLAWEEPRIVASPNIFDRRPDWSAEIRSASEVAYVFDFADGSEQTRYNDLVARLREHVGISEEFDVGVFRVVIPARNVPPELLPAPSE